MIPHLSISRARLAFILGALAMLGPFSIDTIFPAFAVMENELSVTKVAMQQTISLYLLGYAAMSLVHGPLSDALGRRPVILAGIAVFALASVGCAFMQAVGLVDDHAADAFFPRGAGTVGGRWPDRRPGGGPRCARWRRRPAPDESYLDDFRRGAGDRADHRRLDPGLEQLGLMLTAALALPESHPPERRLPLNFGALVGAYRGILGNGRFRLLALAGTANFGALFLYITSAPAFVLDILKLNEQQFGYFFAPTIGGMILGAFLSGRSAGKVTGVRLANTGFVFCGLSALFNIAYNFAFPVPQLPWAVLPTVLSAFGIALVFPILTIAILDMYPLMRGTASSMQAFVGLLSNALIAGLLSPMLIDSPMHLALGAAAFSTVAWLLWRWYLAHCDRWPEASPNAASMEPTDEM